MLAVVKDLPRPRHISLRQVPRPEPAAQWVLVRVELAGICGSDLHTYHWTPDYRKRFAGLLPVVLGHEYTGVVARVGEAVQDIQPGDRVVSRTPISCGDCHPCHAGQEAICEHRRLLGVHYPGAMAAYVTVPAANCHRLPQDFPPRLAVLAEPLSIAFSAVHKAGGLQGKSVAILGPGPLGYLVALLARQAGAARLSVLGLPRDAGRLEFFHQLLPGVDTCQDPAGFRELVRSATGGRGADVVFEASGAPTGLQTALELTAKLGLVVLIGIVAETARVDTNLAVRSQITIQGSPAAPRRLWRRMLDYLSQLPEAERKLFKKVISHDFALEQAREAFELMAAGQGMKITLTP